MTTATLKAAQALARGWAHLYSAGLAPSIRDARREEIAADLDDQEAYGRASGKPDLVTSLHVIERSLLGVHHDLLWRREAASYVPSGAHRRELAVAQRTIEWADEAGDLLRRVGGSVATRHRVRQRLEQRAAEHGKGEVTAAMAEELLQERARWGWGGVLNDYQPARAAETYSGFFGASDPAEAARELKASEGRTDSPREGIVDLYVEQLGLQPGARVLDLGCGWGGVAVPLAKRGFAVTAVDSSVDWLGVARASAELEGVDVRFIEADLLEVPWTALDGEAEFDAVLSIGTLFQGFPESEEEGRRLPLQLARWLKPGGRCLITDFPHAEGVLKTFRAERRGDAGGGTVPTGTAVSNLWMEEGPGTFALFEQRFRPDEGRLYSRQIRILPGGAPRESRRVVHVYALTELTKLLGDAGLVVRDRWSSPNWGSPHVEYEPERFADLAVLAQKEG